LFMEQYGSSIEHSLSLLMYMVPVNDEEDDYIGFQSQCIQTVSDLFELYRTSLLRNPNDVPVAHTVGSLLLQKKRRAYTLAAWALRVVRAIQLLFEMHSFRTHGQHTSLRTCFRIEIIKFALKMFVRSQMPFSFYVDDEAVEAVDAPHAQKPRNTALGDARFPQADSSRSKTVYSKAVTGSGDSFVGRRSGKTLQGLPSVQSSRLAINDGTPLTGQIVLAEALFHGRPLLHLLTLLWRGHKSWLAWLVALLFDRMSVVLISRSLRPRLNTRAAALEEAELKRRQWQTLWAIARTPFFDKFLMRPTQALDRILIKRIPLVNMLNLVELHLALRQFYFTTSSG